MALGAPAPLCPCPQLQELHRAGGDLMHRDERSRTLLHHAVSTGSKDVVRYLLDHGELCHRGAPVGGGRLPGLSDLPLPSPPAPPEILDAVEEK